MARVGGRNTFIAWAVGVGCAAVVGVLVWTAAPMIPASLAFIDQQLNPPTSEPVAGSGDESGEEIGDCRDLYPDELRSSLVWAKESVLTPTTDAPASTAQGLVDALAPQVILTCDWKSVEGTISTTLASVPTDAGAIAETALPALGFTCERVAERTRCVLEAADRVETIDTAGGVWLSTVEDSWHPSAYVDGIADRVWRD